MSRRAVVVTVACIALAQAARADAPAQAKARLYYQKAGASECPDVEVVRTAVADRMGYDPFIEAAPILVLVAIALESESLRRARISLIDETGHEYGQREIISLAPTCNELASTVALVISIAIPAATQRAMETKHAAELERLTKAAYAPLPANATEPLAEMPAPGPETTWRLVVGGRGSVGAVPGVAPGLTLGFGVRHHDFSAALEIIADFGRPQHVGYGTVDASLYRGAAIACRHGGPFALCALLAAGGLRSHGEGFNDNHTITSPYLAVGGRVAYELPLPGGFVAIAHLDAESALDSASIAVTGETMWKWVAPGAALAGGLALGSVFP